MMKLVVVLAVLCLSVDVILAGRARKPSPPENGENPLVSRVAPVKTASVLKLLANKNLPKKEGESDEVRHADRQVEHADLAAAGAQLDLDYSDCYYLGYYASTSYCYNACVYYGYYYYYWYTDEECYCCYYN